MYTSLLTTQDLSVSESDRYFRVAVPQVQLSNPPHLEGCAVHADTLQFDKRLYTREQAQLVSLHAAGAPVRAQCGVPTITQLAAPTEADVRLINQQHALRQLGEDDVAVYDRFVINNQPSRSGLLFTEAALSKFARDFAQGRTVLMYHNQQAPVGRTFRASVTEETIRGVDGSWVRARLYIPKTDSDGNPFPATSFVRTMLDTGVLAFDSIGFGGGKVESIRVGSGENERFYIQIDHDENQQMELEAGELSFVFIGNIRGAGNNKQTFEMDHQQAAVIGPDGGTDPQREGTWGDPGAGSKQSDNHQTITRTWVTY